MISPHSNVIVWLDLETSGLDTSDLILEVPSACAKAARRCDGKVHLVLQNTKAPGGRPTQRTANDEQKRRTANDHEYVIQVFACEKVRTGC